jgi:acyl-CoA thioesterase I
VHRFAAILLALLLSLTGCGSPQLPPLAGDAVVLAFGDSLTFGRGATPEESYPAILQELIARKVVSAAVPGEVTQAGLARLPVALEEHRPKLLILCHGGNDILRNLGMAQAEANLRAMIKIAKERGVAVVVIAVPERGLLLSPAKFYGRIADDLELPLEDDVIGAILGDATLKSDTVHPNAAGYRKLAEAVAALLKKSKAI